MERQSIKTYQEFNEEKFTKRVIFNNGNSTAFVLNFLPGQTLPAHKHPGAEVYLLVVSGNGTIIIDGSESEVTETDLIHTGEDEELSFANTSNDRVSLYVVLNKLSK
ncbi:cupin domain-containing protein [Neobacillus massiliamazoniensis]|jgi:quercetin dioxygenase-like cupin family protein|uniref:Cupin domain protein n=1 Tax=Neobacillus massiliamazoniensis TaxID=1499688 RepID=A0A0U1NYL7_9BACI|nr:cupin domain-containing protein [Neobacillus massiliamazoniensis]CRK83119.1 Cupin domain protein [Neobacillus massiliamazoniensis]